MAVEQPAGIKMHLSLNVSDLERSLAFYEAFFGAPPNKVRPGYANFDLSEPPLKFALNEHPVAAGLGPLSHLGFQMASKERVEAAKERLIAAGLATFDDRDTTCCFARQDKIWAHDPDGNAWEIYVLSEDLPEDDSLDHAGNLLGSEAACCSPALSVPAASCCGPEPPKHAESACPGEE
jgi:catechol 2,3-dioxygenase-like lactoylglutathione lyase family enzyme